MAKILVDKTYFWPGAVWGTPQGVSVLIGKSRPRFYKLYVKDSLKEFELHEKYMREVCSPSLPGYDMWKKLPRSMRPVLDSDHE